MNRKMSASTASGHGSSGQILEQKPDRQRKRQERGGAASHTPQNVNDRIH
jgi:hypothetical protein